jgi:hypothetical protein
MSALVAAAVEEEEEEEEKPRKQNVGSERMETIESGNDGQADQRKTAVSANTAAKKTKTKQRRIVVVEISDI